MIKRHIYFDNDTLNILYKYQSQNNISFSQAIRDLIFIGTKNISIDKEIIELKEREEKIINVNYLQLDLIKQLYSDLEIQNITNPNKNKALQNFFKNRSGGVDE